MVWSTFISLGNGIRKRVARVAEKYVDRRNNPKLETVRDKRSFEGCSKDITKYIKRKRSNGSNRYSLDTTDIKLIYSPRKINLIDEVNSRLQDGKVKGDLEGAVYGFMQNLMLDNNFDYENIDKLDKIAKYFGKLSKNPGVKEDTRKALESARTVLLHLDNYLSGNREEDFKEYLFGKNGALTQKRLDDMKRVTKMVAGRDKDKIKDQRNHIYAVGDEENEKFNTFNVSYKSHLGNKILVNINDDNSQGMYSDHGKLYWNSLDQMFDKYERGRINTRKTVTNSVKDFVNYEISRDNAEKIRGYDWKKRELRDYALFRK